MKKRWKLLGAVFVLSIIMAACGKKVSEEEQTSTANTSFDKNSVYRETEVKFGDNYSDLIQFSVTDDTLYLEGYQYSFSEMTEEEQETQEEQAIQEVQEMPPSTLSFTSYDFEGNQKGELKLTIPSNASPGVFRVDSKGNLYSVYIVYSDMEEGFSGNEAYLSGHTPEGEEIFHIRLNEQQKNDDYYYVNQMFLVDDSKLILEASTGVEIYDLQGSLVNRIEKKNDEDNRLLRIKDDQFIIMSNDGEKSSYQTINLETGAKEQGGTLPFNYYMYSTFSGKYFDLYLSDEKGVYGFNLGDEQLTTVMDFISSDFSSYGISQMEVLDEERMLLYYYGDEGNQMGLFEKVPAEEIGDRQILTLGCFYMDMDVKAQVVAFNKKSTTHRISVIDYSSFNTEEDYSLGMTRLNTDITSGNAPDIILLQQYGMPLESYMAKGVFVDYYELMAEDSSFNKEDYLQNLFEAYEYNGKLYQMVPSFYVATFVGKAADVGEDFSWTMEEALALQASKPEGTNLFSNITQYDFLYNCLTFCEDDYVNWEAGECYFDTDKFIRMLEYAKTLPKDYNYVDYEDEAAYQEMENQYRDGKTLLMQTGMSSFRDYGNWRYAYFGEEITTVGFPTETGIGSAFGSSINLAISAQTKNKEAAWEFVKSFLDEEYQEKRDWYFPIRLSSLDKIEKQAQQKPFYTDEKGNKIEYENTYWLGNMEIKADPLSKEETAKVMDLIKSINRAANYDEELLKIVQEESAGFLEGQKSAQEVAGIIQSRAKIYINENR